MVIRFFLETRGDVLRETVQREVAWQGTPKATPAAATLKLERFKSMASSFLTTGPFGPG